MRQIHVPNDGRGGRMSWGRATECIVHARWPTRAGRPDAFLANVPEGLAL
jgi:hypothetical protein